MNKQLRALYAMHSIDWFASVLIGIFVPIYFLSLGFTLAEIFIYFIILCAGFVGAFFIAGQVANRYGLKECLIIRLPFKYLQLALLFFLPQYSFLLYAVAIINAVQVGFYWFPFHVIFAQNSSRKKLGKEVGRMGAFPQMGSVVAPLAGAFITASFGFNYLFLAAGILHLFTLIPFYYLKNWQSSVRFHPSVIFEMFKKYKKFFGLMVVSSGVAEVEGVILPIFVYLTFANIISVGTIGAFAGVGAVFFTLLVGRFADSYRKEKIMKIGASVMIVIWLLRFFHAEIAFYYMLSVVAGFFLILINIPLGTIYYGLAKTENIDEFVFFREIAVNLGRVITYSLALAIALKINYSFLMAAAALLGFLFI
ncbi:MAG: MFS transporter [Patescibacteria group bacterium]|jgi:MFS family permease